MPKVSVLMPTYNTNEEHLTNAINAILAQTLTDFEFIILDDASSGASVTKIVEGYKDTRIKFFRNDKNLGISQTRNKLIQLAQGRYLAVQDHDDIPTPNRLEVQANFLDTHPEVGVVGSYYTIMPDNKVILQPTNHKDILKYLMYICYIPHPVAMIRKNVLIENNIFYEEEFSPAEDYRLWCQLIGKTKFANLPLSLLTYNWHETNTSKVKATQMHQVTQVILKAVRKEHPEIWEQAQTEIPIEEKKYKLFKKMTLLKSRKQNNQTCYYLFGRIPFLWKQERIRYKFHH